MTKKNLLQYSGIILIIGYLVASIFLKKEIFEKDVEEVLLKQETIELDYLNYVYEKNNEMDTKNFTTTYLDNEKSLIQTYYYLKIKELTKGEISSSYYEDLKNLLKDEYYFSIIVYYIVKNSNAFSENELNIIKKTYLEELEEIDDRDNRKNENFYKILTLNEIDSNLIGDRYNEWKLHIYTTIVNEKTSVDKRLIYLYLYSVMNGNNRLENYEEIKSIYEETINEIKGVNNYPSLNNYFEFRASISKSQYDLFDLLEPNLEYVYLNLANLVYGKVMTAGELEYIDSYLDNLYDKGFPLYIYESNENVGYMYIMLLNSLFEKKHKFNEYENLSVPIFNDNYDLSQSSYFYLYMLSLVQERLTGTISENLKKEVIYRIENNKNIFNEGYYLFLIESGIKKEIKKKYLNEKDLVSNIEKHIDNEDVVGALRQLDLLTLYFKNKNNKVYYEKIVKISENNMTLNNLSVLTNIGRRLNIETGTDLGKIISKIDSKNNFVTIKEEKINKLQYYYDYYLIKYMENNKYSTKIKHITF